MTDDQTRKKNADALASGVFDAINAFVAKKVDAELTKAQSELVELLKGLEQRLSALEQRNSKRG